MNVQELEEWAEKKIKFHFNWLQAVYSDNLYRDYARKKNLLIHKFLLIINNNF